MTDSVRTKNQHAAAVALGITVKTLIAWSRMHWWQDEFRTKAGYDVEAIRAACPSIRKSTEHEKFTSDTRKISQATKAIDLQLRQLALKEKSGELVKFDEVSAAYHQANEHLIGLIQDLKVRIGRMLPEGSVRVSVMEAVDVYIRQMLKSHSDYLKHQEERFQRKKKTR